MDHQDIGAAVCIGECRSHCHLATESRIWSLELEYLDYLLVGHKLGEVAVVGVGTGGRLAGAGRRIVGERDTE